MNTPFVVDTLFKLAPGLPLTLELTGASLVLGAMLGLVLAVARLSGVRVLQAVAWTYIQVVRSVPLVVIMFLTYYGLSQFDWIRSSFLWPMLRDAYWCALIALTINTSAYAAEIIRGGILSVKKGDIEAAQAFGMSRVLTFRRIVLPIAIRQALPAYGNEMIAMVKATSLASLVTLMDVTGIAASIASETYRPVEVFVAAGVVYLAITFALTRIVSFAEARLNPHLQRTPRSARSGKESTVSA